MATLPIVYPPNDGPGRLLEIVTFRRSGIPETKYDEALDAINQITSTFPISRQNLSGRKVDQKDITVMIADWTSAEEKDVFEPGEQYQSIKPAFGELVDSEDHCFTCHHLILPGASTTPEVGVYVVEVFNVSKLNQSNFATSLKQHVKAVAPLFFVAGPSREDAETVVGIWGFKSEADAAAYVKKQYAFEKSLGSLSGSFSSYQANLKKWTPSK